MPSTSGETRPDLVRDEKLEKVWVGELLRPAFKSEPRRPGEHLLKTVRQLIESINETLQAQLDLQRHGGRTTEGVAVRVLQRILALTAAIWHNHHTGQPVVPSLIAYDRKPYRPAAEQCRQRTIKNARPVSQCGLAKQRTVDLIALRWLAIRNGLRD